jgi:hypothetical protein
MPLRAIADSFYIGVLDVVSATSWYIEKLGLQKVPAEMDDPEECVALGFFKKEQTCIAVLGPRDKLTDGTKPMLRFQHPEGAGGLGFSERECRRDAGGSARHALLRDARRGRQRH